MLYGLGYRVEDVGCRVLGLNMFDFALEGLGFRGSGFRVFEPRPQNLNSCSVIVRSC